MPRSFSRISTVFVLAIIVSMFAGCGRPAPGETVKKFYLAIQDRRYDDALECAPKSIRDTLETTDPWTGVSRKATLFNEWDKGIRTAPSIKKFVVLKERVDGNRATVEFELHYAGSGLKKGRRKLDLTWEDGAWRILMM